MPQTVPDNAAFAPPFPEARFRIVAFDFDGTLADSFGWFSGVLNDVADRFEFRRIEAHETERMREMDARQIIRHLGIPAWKVPFIARHMHAMMARDIASIELFEGVPAMLNALAAEGFKLAVVSSNSEVNIRTVLGPMSMLIDSFACGATLFGKARRLRALANAFSCAPNQVLAIGDEIRDLEAAREAGCAFGAVAWGYTDWRALAAGRPDYLFERPAQIVPILRPDLRWAGVAAL